jgi:hypothetical protein
MIRDRNNLKKIPAAPDTPMDIGETKEISPVGKSKPHQVKLLETIPLPKGTRAKERWRLELSKREKTRAISLVKIKVEIPAMYRGELSSADYVADLWTTLKQIGIPVVPTLVVLSDNEVAMTDLTADGSGLYGKDNWGNNFSPQKTDAIFHDIDLEEVKKQALTFARLAANNHIGLSPDHSFDLLVHPDGSWQPLARDIKNTQLVGSSPDQDFIFQQNSERVDRFVAHLERTKRDTSSV